LGATGIFAFLLAWDEFVLALVFTKTTNSITIPVFISALGSQYIHAFDQIAASGFIASACACLHADRFARRQVFTPNYISPYVSKIFNQGLDSRKH
jgi:multiple sugar transport system permease protein